MSAVQASNFLQLPWEKVAPFLDAKSVTSLAAASQNTSVFDRLVKLAKKARAGATVSEPACLKEMSDLYLHHGSRSVLQQFLKARKTLVSLRLSSPPRSPALVPASLVEAAKRKVTFTFSPALHASHKAEPESEKSEEAPPARRKTLKLTTPAVARHTKSFASTINESPIRQLRLNEPLPVEELRQMDNPATAVVQAIKFRGAGSLKRAWLFLDMNNNGKLSADELQYGLQLLQIEWAEITDFPTFNELFMYFQDILHEYSFSTTKILPITYDSLVYISSLTTKNRDLKDWNMLNTREQWAAYSAATVQPSERKRDPSWTINSKKVLPRVVDRAAKAIATREEMRKQGPTHPSMRAFLRKSEKLVGAHFIAEIQEELRRLTRRVQGLSEPRRELSKAKHQLHLVVDPTYDPRAERRKAELDRKRKALEGGFFSDKFKAAVSHVDTSSSCVDELVFIVVR